MNHRVVPWDRCLEINIYYRQ